MVAHLGQVAYLDLGHLAPNGFGKTDPELAGIGLGFGVGAPVVAHMFVLAGDLAAVAAVADG